MDWFVKRFLRAALVWLGLGVTMGVAMAIYPDLIIYRPAHVHMNLLGFVTMMIYGVAYHVVPPLLWSPASESRARGCALVDFQFRFDPDGRRLFPRSSQWS